jgi:Arc/MetJ family transcription regulator
MRTNIALDDTLVAEAMAMAGARSKREGVDIALRELVARRRQRGLARLVGRGLIDPAYDVRRVRQGMPRGAGR